MKTNTSLTMIENKQTSSISKVKIGLITLLALLVYGYVLIIARAIQTKMRRMEQLGVMVMETEQMVDDLHALDRNFAAQLQQFNEFYTDY